MSACRSARWRWRWRVMRRMPRWRRPALPVSVLYTELRLMPAAPCSPACGGCHGATLRGDPIPPALVGPGFMGAWGGRRSSADYFRYVQAQMPCGTRQRSGAGNLCRNPLPYIYAVRQGPARHRNDDGARFDAPRHHHRRPCPRHGHRCTASRAGRSRPRRSHLPAAKSAMKPQPWSRVFLKR